MEIKIQNSPNIKVQRQVQNTVKNFLKSNCVNPDAVLNVSFVSQSKISALNKKYRQIDAPTDVISFPIWPERYEIPKKGKINLGDIFVCPDFTQGDIGEIIEHSLNHLIGKHH